MRAAQTPEQVPERSRAEPAAGLNRGRGRGDPQCSGPQLLLELLEQHPQHLGIAGGRAQPQSEDEVQRYAGRQGTHPPFPAPAVGDHLIHEAGDSNCGRAPRPRSSKG